MVSLLSAPRLRDTCARRISIVLEGGAGDRRSCISSPCYCQAFLLTCAGINSSVDRHPCLCILDCETFFRDVYNGYPVSIQIHISRMMACRGEETSASTKATQSPRPAEETPTTPAHLTTTLHSSLEATITTQATSIQPYNSTSQSPSAILTPESQDVLSTRTWIGICAGVSVGMLLIAVAAVLLALRMRQRRREARKRYIAQAYPLKRILDEGRVHTLMDLSRYRELSALI
jgi:hypothetical protein